MVKMFFIIVILITIGLLGGLIYLIYLPIKKILIKSGKLTEKLNRRINWTFILSLFLLSILLYCLKDYRSSSKTRLENISDVKMPKDIKVLKDEYQDMWQDYCILYDIKLDNNASLELIKNIKEAKFYNKRSFYNRALTDDEFSKIDSVNAVWYKSPKGYDFSRQDGLTSYHIEFDTVKNILKYTECSD